MRYSAVNATVDHQLGEPINPIRKSIEAFVESNGRLSARTTVTVGSQVSGEIVRLEADFNDDVLKGQVVAEINPSRHIAQVRSAQASLDAARSRFARALSSEKQIARDLKRAELLSERRLISDSDLEKSKDRESEASSKLKEMAADVGRLEAALDNAKYDLEQTVIRSPVNGVVLERLVETGQTVAASFETPALFRIAEDLSEMVIELAVDESDIGTITVGQLVTFSVEAYPARDFFGRITQKRLAPSVKSNNAKYPVIVAVNNAEGLLLPGMLADARVVVNRRDNVLSLPTEYISQQGSMDKIPDESLIKKALRAIGEDIITDRSDALKFLSLVETLDISPRSSSANHVPELVNFFGSQMASQIVVLDDSSGDPTVALRKHRLKAITQLFSNLLSSVNLITSNKIKERFSDVVNSRQASVWVLTETGVSERSVLLGINDDTSVQVVYGLDEGDQVVSKGRD